MHNFNVTLLGNSGVESGSSDERQQSRNTSDVTYQPSPGTIFTIVYTILILIL